MVGDRASYEAAVKRGHAHAWEKRWMKAIEEYELATAEFPDDVTARSGLAFAFYQAERLREALREYRKLSELRPYDPSPIEKVAEILEKLGRSSDAAGSWMTLASISERQRDSRRALQSWRRAVRLEATSKKAHLGLAEAYSAASMATEAAKEQLEVARLSYEDGDATSALEHCQRALELDRHNRGAKALLERLASETGTSVPYPAAGSVVEELGPVNEAVRRALGALAEDLLGAGELFPSPEMSNIGAASKADDEVEPTQLATILARAIDLHARGLRKEALGCYKQVLDAGLERVEVLLGLGILCTELSRWEEASRYMQSTLRSPDYAMAGHLVLGQCHWALGQPNVALDHFLKALATIDLETLGEEHSEEVRRAYDRLAESQSNWGEGRGSEELVDSVLSLLEGEEWRARIAEARRRLDSVAEERAVPILPEVLYIPGGDEVVDSMIEASDYLNKGMPFSAVEECYRAIRLAPGYLPLHLKLAQIFAEQGKADEAVSKYTAVAESYLWKGDTAKAIEIYRKALAAAPMAIAVGEKLIELLIGQGEIDQALDEYLALAETCYGLARVDSALSKYEEALAMAEKTKTPEAWRVRILHRVADLQMQRVHWNEAEKIYAKILAISPDDEQAAYRMVELRYRLGHESQALRDLDDLIVRCGRRNDFQGLIKMLRELAASNPQDLSIRSRLSRIYIGLEMKTEAIAELDVIGELQLEAGRKEEAVRTLRTIIDLEPDEKDSYTQLLEELDQGAGAS
jgi:tetratricopeptide (TPR) repeat protein